MLARVNELDSIGMISLASSVVGTLIALVLDFALLAVALGPVRRHRPELSGLLATAALVLAGGTLCAPALHAIAPMVAMRGSDSTTSSIVIAQTGVGLLLTIVRVTGTAMIIATIARLAVPARHDPREPS